MCCSGNSAKRTAASGADGGSSRERLLTHCDINSKCLFGEWVCLLWSTAVRNPSSTGKGALQLSCQCWWNTSLVESVIAGGWRWSDGLLPAASHLPGISSLFLPLCRCMLFIGLQARLEISVEAGNTNQSWDPESDGSCFAIIPTRRCVCVGGLFSLITPHLARSLGVLLPWRASRSLPF